MKDAQLTQLLAGHGYKLYFMEGREPGDQTLRSCNWVRCTEGDSGRDSRVAKADSE